MESILNHPQFDDIAHGLELDRGLPLGTLKAVALQESGGRSDADSGKAHGLMQFTPATAKAYNVDTSNPWDSLRGSADLLSDLQQQHGSTNAALAAYNGGTSQGKLVAAGKEPSYPETKNYVEQVNQKMQQTAPDDDKAFSAVQSSVVAMRNQGYSDVYITGKLSKSPVGDAVAAAKQQGMSDSDIVTKLGGAPLQAVNDAKAKVDAMSVPETAWEQAKNTGNDLVSGAQQVGARLTGNDAKLKALQDEQAQTDADPTRQAVRNTTTGAVTNFGLKALPYAAAAAVGPEALVPMALTQGAVGAADGALTPTTGDGQFGKNITTNAALAGGGAAVGGGLAKLLVKGANGAIAPAADAADRSALIAAGKKQGLPVTASDVSPFWKNVADGNQESAAVKGHVEAADAAVAKKVAEGLGEDNHTGPINTDLLNKARTRIGETYDNTVGQVNVQLPESLTQNLHAMVSDSTNPLTDGIANHATVLKAITNLNKAVEDGTTVSGRQLQDLASELKELTRSQTATHTEKSMAGKVVGQIQDQLDASLSPEQQTAYRAANGQYRNLKAVEKMVSLSNDTGTVSPRQLVQAVKTGGFKNQFLKGDAPYQDLAVTANDLYGPANGKGLGNVINKSMHDGHDGTFALYAALEAPHMIPVMAGKMLAKHLLAKAATSTNPAIVKLLSRTSGSEISPVMAKYIAKALGTSGSAVSSN